MGHKVGAGYHKFGSGFHKLELDFTNLDKDFTNLEQDFTNLEQDFTNLEQDFTNLQEQDFKTSEQDFTNLEQVFTNLIGISQIWNKISQSCKQTRKKGARLIHGVFHICFDTLFFGESLPRVNHVLKTLLYVRILPGPWQAVTDLD